LFKNVSKNDSYIGMVEHVMKRGFDIVRVLEDVCLGVQDAQVPEPRKMAAKSGGVKNGRTFVFPAREARGGNSRVGSAVVGRVKEIGSVHTDTPFLGAFDPRKRRKMKAGNEAK
jgi:hypothetical protein